MMEAGPYFWGVKLNSNVERKLSIGRRKIVGASCCIANIIRCALILGQDEREYHKDTNE